MSMFTSFALLYPEAQVVMLVFPLPSRLALALFAAYDYMYIGRGRIDHAGHLGGAAYGALFTMIFYRVKW